jgi:hypothetical protein
MVSGQKIKFHKIAIHFLQKVETIPKFDIRSKLLQIFAEDLK